MYYNSEKESLHADIDAKILKKSFNHSISDLLVFNVLVTGERTSNKDATGDFVKEEKY